MIAYVTVGADDIASAKHFYSAFLPALDYGLKERPEGLGYALPEPPGQSAALPDFYVKSPFNERPASAGNGAMIAFEARNQMQVRDLHSAALDAGGFDEGQPGFHTSYGPHCYVGIRCFARQHVRYLWADIWSMSGFWLKQDLVKL